MKTSKVLLATMVASMITGSVFATPTTTGNHIVGGTDNVVYSTSTSSAVWGHSNSVDANNALAFGTDNTVTGENGFAGGNNAIAKGRNSFAFGSHAESLVGYMVAIGNQARTASYGSIAIGNGAFVSGAHATYTELNNLGTKVAKNHDDIVGTVKCLPTFGDIVSDNVKDIADLKVEAVKHSSVVGSENITVTTSTNATGGKEYKVALKDDIQLGANTDPIHSVVNKDGVIAFNGSLDTKYSATGTVIEDHDTLNNASYGIEGMTADSNGKRVEFTTNGISVGGQTIANVKAGVADTDAVNVKQLSDAKDTINTTIKEQAKEIANNKAGIQANTNFITEHEARVAVLEKDTNVIKSDLASTQAQVNVNTQDIADLRGKVDKSIDNVLNQSKSYTDSRVAKVGAKVSALAALHPLDFNPNSKLEFAVGYGNYKGANAIALGAFYRPNENFMLSAGTTLGSENAVNIGATIRFGKASQMTNDRIKELNNQVWYLSTKYAQLEDKYNELMKALEEKNK